MRMNYKKEAKGLVIENFKIFLFCLLVTTLFLAIRSKSSPLYPMNDWVDVNAYFSMGKGMFNGMVPFKDLFEQKGPLLYFIFGLGWLISNDTFLGVFIFEVLFFTIFLFFSVKLMKLFLKNRVIYVLIIVFAYVLIDAGSFGHGSSCEEFCLPFMMYSLYALIRYLKLKDLSYKIIMINGMVAGCIFMMKYTLLGLWIGWILCVFIILIKQGNIKKAFLSCFVYLFGMLIAILPWGIYFIYNDAIKEFFDVYIVFNVGAYGQVATTNTNVVDRVSTLDKLIKPLFYLRDQLFIGYNYILTFLFLVLGVYYFKNKNISLEIKIWSVTLFVISAYFVYFGSAFKYYFLILAPFVIFGLFSTSKLVNKFLDSMDSVGISSNETIFILLAISIGGLLATNPYKDFLNKDKDELVQYKFADIINSKEGSTLLNYNFIDMGFYAAADKIPTQRYFETVNVSYQNYPEIYDEQNRYLAEERVDYVILRVDQGYIPTKEAYPYIYSNYKEISQGDQFYEGKVYTYHLYENIESEINSVCLDLKPGIILQADDVLEVKFTAKKDEQSVMSIVLGKQTINAESNIQIKIISSNTGNVIYRKNLTMEDVASDLTNYLDFSDLALNKGDEYILQITNSGSNENGLGVYISNHDYKLNERSKMYLNDKPLDVQPCIILR